MGNKRTCRRPAIKRLQNRRLDLNKPMFIQVPTHGTDSTATYDEYLSSLITISDQIKVAFALTNFLVLQAMIFLRQGTQPFSKDAILEDMECTLSCTRAEKETAHLDEIAQVQEFDASVCL